MRTYNDRVQQTVYGLGDVSIDFGAEGPFVYDYNTDPGWSGTPTSTTNGTTTVGTSGVTDALKIMSGITNSFTNIFKSVQPLPQGCQQVAGPYGVSTQCTQQGSNAFSMLNSPVGGGLLSSPIVLVGIGLVALMVFRGKG